MPPKHAAPGSPAPSPKRAPKAKSFDIEGYSHGCAEHEFSGPEVATVREQLLAWFDSSKRDMPW